MDDVVRETCSMHGEDEKYVKVKGKVVPMHNQLSSTP
jgi:hypothetical protein